MNMPVDPQPVKPVYIKRFGRPMLIQALMGTAFAPFLLLFPDHGSKSTQVVAVVGVAAVFWIVWAIWGRSSVEIDAESFTVKKAGTRIYPWSDGPKFIFHRYSWKNRLAYLEVIRHDHISDTFDTQIADDGFLAEIHKYAAIENTDDLLPRRRYG